MSPASALAKCLRTPQQPPTFHECRCRCCCARGPRGWVRRCCLRGPSPLADSAALSANQPRRTQPPDGGVPPRSFRIRQLPTDRQLQTVDAQTIPWGYGPRAETTLRRARRDAALHLFSPFQIRPFYRLIKAPARLLNEHNGPTLRA
jgi:hypothetical protein